MLRRVGVEVSVSVQCSGCQGVSGGCQYFCWFLSCRYAYRVQYVQYGGTYTCINPSPTRYDVGAGRVSWHAPRCPAGGHNDTSACAKGRYRVRSKEECTMASDRLTTCQKLRRISKEQRCSQQLQICAGTSTPSTEAQGRCRKRQHRYRVRCRKQR